MAAPSAEYSDGSILGQDHTRRRGKRRLLGFGSPSVEYNRNEETTFDYEEKYAPDEEYKEMGPKARVWLTYLDESKKIEDQRVEEWRDVLDVVLVFSSLFTMVVSILVSRTFHSLRINYKEVMTILMGELLDIQRAAADGRPISDVPSDLWVNGLWFTSFALSLLVAILAMLAKQWLRQYTSYTSGDARDVARIRHFRLMSLEKWHVPQIISLLPVLMQITLGLFVAGLVIFLFDFSAAIGIAFGSASGAAFVAHVASTLLPLVDPDCPYKTTLSSYLFKALSFFRCSDASSDKAGSLPDMERDAILLGADELDAEALSWLHETSDNDSVRTVVDQVLKAARTTEDARAQRDGQPEAGPSHSST
ncbi:hypothetical protein BDZ89DRAFT_1169573 [Hymenopellis radicata]|nr:hypothetical protein BDZ89DRAFT_1169573 [Hymenopellis radicata]